MVFKSIVKLLDSCNIEYKVLEHERVHTCQDAAKIRGTTPEQGAKALVCVADKDPILVVLSCSSKLDFKKFKKWQGVKDLRMATADEVKQITRISIGSIAPIGKVFDLPTYVDKSLLEQTEICFNAGLHEKSILMKSADYIFVTEPVPGEFVDQG